MDDVQSHICPRGLLGLASLRFARLRMRWICPEIFSVRSDQGALSLMETIIIILSLKETDRLSAGYSRHCGKPTTYAWALHQQMVTAAADVVERSPNLQTLRILCHKESSLKVVAVDCVTTSRMIVDDESDWDWGDDGQADPDGEECSDQQGISSLSSGYA